jgi:hypothetical protein
MLGCRVEEPQTGNLVFFTVLHRARLGTILRPIHVVEPDSLTPRSLIKPNGMETIPKANRTFTRSTPYIAQYEERLSQACKSSYIIGSPIPDVW